LEQTFLRRWIAFAGRERPDGLDCWVAVTTEAFAHKLLAELMPAGADGALPVQTAQTMAPLANLIWQALWDVLKPLSGDRSCAQC
jgi:hypothetical protein